MQSFFFIIETANRNAAIEVLLEGGTFYQRVNGGLVELVENRSGIPWFSQGEYGYTEIIATDCYVLGVKITSDHIKKFWEWFDGIKERYC